MRFFTIPVHGGDAAEAAFNQCAASFFYLQATFRQVYGSHVKDGDPF